jgi:hypothetical protein
MLPMAGLVRRRSSVPLPPLPPEKGVSEQRELIRENLHWRGRVSEHGPSGSLCLGSARIDNRRQLLEQLLTYLRAEAGTTAIDL